MKPVAPSLAGKKIAADQPTLLSEIRRLCDTKASDERITIPPPSSADDTIPPSGPTSSESGGDRDTVPAPPPSASRRRAESQPDGDVVPSTIPEPPRLPSVAI